MLTFLRHNTFTYCAQNYAGMPIFGGSTGVLIYVNHHRLTGLVHDLSKTEADVLKRCAHFFKTLSQPLSAAMVYEKLGDTAAVLGLYVESKQWDMVGS